MQRCKVTKRGLLLIAALLGLFACVLFAPHSVRAASRWAAPITSYVEPQSDGSLMRLKADNGKHTVYAEYYDQNANLLSTKEIKFDLSIFGAFYSDGNYNYLLTGQDNPNESDDVEVYRITKYDLNWNRLESCSLHGANTYEPFAFGSARMTSDGEYLLIRTCHTMYATSDGLHHQANVTIEVDTDTMQVTDSYTQIMNVNYGYVSHSFNQFVRTDGTNLVGVDLGDAYPRAVVLCKYTTDFTTGNFTGDWDPCEYAEMLPISGQTGNNTTGVTVGGFEVSSDRYIVVGTTIDQNHFTTSDTGNIFISTVDRNLSDEPEITYLTNYSEGSESAGTPVLVKLSDSRFMILWEHEKKVNYAELDAEGHIKGSIHTMAGHVSDEQPAIYNGNIVWTASTPVLYKVNVNQPDKNSAQNLKQPMYRLYNENSGEHFYTAREGEAEHLVSVGWDDEGIGWYAPATSKTPVYRLYNKNAGDHHYTANVKERNYLVKIGWNDEGIGWYSNDAENVPLYRQYNPNAKAGAHNYTTSKAENNALVKAGWKEEGIGWYGVWEF